MNIVVDANIFKGYYLEKILELDHGLTDSPSYIFEDNDLVLYFDENSQIYHEYSTLINSKDAEEIIIGMINTGKIRFSKTQIDTTLEKSMKALGFDLNSRDKWYVRTALVVKNYSEDESLYFITEDIDFYNPTKKGCDSDERTTIIKNPKSPISRELIKKKDIKPICVENYTVKAY